MVKKSVSSPLVSVVIATKNEAMNIQRLLKSLLKQTFTSLEIIIVDNYSTDTTLEIVKKFPVQVFSYSGERSKQRNFGVLKSRGRHLLLLDADMELPSTVIADCVKAIQTNLSDAVIIPETVKGKGWFTRVKKLEKQLYLNEPVIEAARFIKKSVFLKVGGFRENLVAGEDWDLSQRVSRIGNIGRTRTSLYHYETSFWRELKHKFYYAKHIQVYARYHPQQFLHQSGWFRLKLMARKFPMLLADPLAAAVLIITKFIEFAFFQLIRLNDKLT